MKINFKQLLKGTEFEAKADCIARVLEQSEIDTLQKIADMPGIIGGNICQGVSIHGLSSLLYQKLSARAEEELEELLSPPPGQQISEVVSSTEEKKNQPTLRGKQGSV